jgi:hypothetical protein
MNLIKTLKPFITNNKDSRVAMAQIVRQGSTTIATDGKVMALVGPSAAQGPVVGVESGQEVSGYPNWQRVVPTELQLFLRVDRKNLLATASAFADVAKALRGRGKQDADAIRFDLRDGKIVATFANFPGVDLEASFPVESHDCDVRGAFGFGAGYLVKVLQSLDCHTVSIYCQPGNAEDRGMVFKAHGSDIGSDLRVILMPVKLRLPEEAYA